MHDQANDNSADTKQPVPETMANLALILNVAAVVAFAICVGGGVSGGIAATVGSAAALCFLASLVCFAADNGSTPAPARERAPLPGYGAPAYALGGAA